MRAWLAFLAVAALLVVAALLGSLWMPLESAPTSFEVPSGATLTSVASRLEEAGLIRGAWQLKLLARMKGAGNQLKAGRYEMPGGASVAELLELMVRGKVVTVAVTLPEGWTARQMTTVLADSLSLDRERLLDLVRTPAVATRKRLGLPGGQGLEGYLFPETYRFAPGVDEAQVIRAMTDQLEAVLTDSLRSRAVELELTTHRLLTLASIVEAEASRAAEAPKVAAVYWNRLRKGWKLEADPTVAYVLDKQGKTITFADLEVDSPYNTYRNPGLPPGPINSPGRVAIRATLWPEVDFPAMYFVADARGGHVFSETWEEHRQAVAEYRRQRRRLRAEREGS